MNRWKTALFAAPLIVAVFLSIAGAEPCGSENCSMPAGTADEQKPVVVQSNFPKLAPAQGTPYPPANRQSGKTAPVAVAPPPIPGRTEIVTRQQPAKTPQTDPAKRQLLTEFGEPSAPSPDEEALYAQPQRITPEGPSQVFLSSSDINRIICPVEIRDVIYSKEKGLTVRLADNNAFVKFLVMKKDGKDLYTTTPSEIYIVCGESVYAVIAIPRRIPAQTVQLSGGKADSIKKNLAFFSEVPFEKRIIGVIKKIYTDNVPDSFTVRKMDKSYPLFQGLFLVLHAVVTIDGEGLRIKEYRARIADASKENVIYLREKDFLTTELAQRPVAISIDIMNLKKGETSRIFVVEKTEGGQP
jgi:conjugal transfer pilus assembly protein TraK